MKQFLSLLFFISTLTAGAGNSTDLFIAPTNPSYNFSVTNMDGDRVSMQWVNGNGAKRIVIARKGAPVTSVPVNGTDYNHSNVFQLGNELNTGEYVIADGSASSASLSGLSAGTTYHFAVFEYNGSGAAIEYLLTPLTGTATTLSAPNVQPSSLSVTNLTGHSMTVNWVNGQVTGSGRIVIARAGAPVNVNPVDLAPYTANNLFGSGTQIGNGNFVIYKGTGSSVNTDNLDPNTTYYFSIFEYTGTQGLVYNVTAPPSISAITNVRPTLAASALNFLSVDGNRFGISMNRGNGAFRIVIAKQGSPVTAIPQDGIEYNGNAAFQQGDEIAPGEFVLSAGTAGSYNVTNLTIGNTYYFAVFEYDGKSSGITYQQLPPLTGSQATVSAPAIHSSNITFSNILSNSLTINWNTGDGAKRMVVMRRDNPITNVPNNLTYYSPSASFGSGTTFGGGYVVYSSTGNSVNITGLTAGATYHVAIFEYNGISYPAYLTAGAPAAIVNASLAPTLPPHSLQFSNVESNRMNIHWANGNGNRRLIIARAGNPVTYVPVNNSTYTASPIFTSGQQVAPGEYVLFNGNVTNSFLISNLLPATNYYFAVYEYNTSGSNSYFLTSSYLSGSRSTQAAPTLNSNTITFTNINGSSLKVNWNSGNGTNRLLLAKKGSPVNDLPADLSSYSDESIFGTGVQIGAGNYVVYNGNANNKIITGLEPGTTYYFKIIEYNGATHPVYLLTGNATGMQTTAERPATPASLMNFTEVEGNKIKVKWTNGNGVKRILVAKQGSPVTGTPADGTTYSPGAYGTGDELGAGEYIISDNSFSESVVTGLLPNTVYHFAVFEYDGAGTNTRYLVTSFGTGSQATVSAPSQQASNVLFSSVTSNSINVNWTTGNGARRLVVVKKGSPVDALPQNLQQYAGNPSFGSINTLVAAGNYAVYNNTGNSVPVSNLTSGTTYYFAVFEMNGISGPVYNHTLIATGNATTLGAPADPAQSIVFTSTGNNSSVNIRWANGSGQKRLVLVKENAAVDAVPSDNATYTGNSFYTGGTQLGTGNYAVYTGNGDNVTVTNLTHGKLYHVAIFEYNSFPTGNMFLVNNPATAIWAGAPLPVKLLSFDGQNAGGENALTWKTAQEINSAHFIVQRSLNGNTFSEIGRINASGNSNTVRHYHFNDITAPAKAFYRLEMIDLNGKKEYSKIILIDAKVNTGETLLYPAVTTSVSTLQVHSATASAAVVKITDNRGAVLRSFKLNLAPGINKKQIDIIDLPAGTYNIQVITNENKVKTMRLIKI